MFWWLLGVDSTQNYGDKTKSLTQDFIDFATKTWLSFLQISHNYLLFLHIIVWFYFIFMISNWNNRIENLKISLFFKILSY